MSMETAAQELCEELYQLSGWDDTAGGWEDRDKGYPVFNSSYVVLPSYDLGYLLRKLPKSEVTDRKLRLMMNAPVASRTEKEGWLFYYGIAEGSTLKGFASSPEDAAAKLAIELFKSGILTREGSA